MAGQSPTFRAPSRARSPSSRCATWLHGRAIKNKEALANPEAVELFRNLPCGAFCGLPPVMQEASGPFRRVIECGLLSGVHMRHFQKPLAGMVICRSGPNLNNERIGSLAPAGFPDPDQFDRCANSGRRFLTSPLPAPSCLLQVDHAAAADAVFR